MPVRRAVLGPGSPLRSGRDDRSRRVGLLPIIGLALTTTAFAQTPPPEPPTDPGSTVVAELEVIGRPPGPALWRARRGDSQVVILGAVSPLPHSLDWNEARIGRALDGARVLLTPPVARAGVLDLPGLAFKAFRARTGKPLAQTTPAPVYARVVAAAQIAHLPPQKLDGWRPVAAALILDTSFLRAAGLSTAKPASTVARLARARGVPVRPMARLKAMPLLDALVRLEGPREIACLDGAAEDVRWQAAHAVPAARAWADGKVAEARAHDRPGRLEQCLEGSAVRAMIDRGVEEGLTAVEAELAKPGKAVVVVDLKYLAVANGLLDRLRARGAEITTPP